MNGLYSTDSEPNRKSVNSWTLVPSHFWSFPFPRFCSIYVNQNMSVVLELALVDNRSWANIVRKQRYWMNDLFPTSVDSFPYSTIAIVQVWFRVLAFCSVQHCLEQSKHPFPFFSRNQLMCSSSADQKR